GRGRRFRSGGAGGDRTTDRRCADAVAVRHAVDVRRRRVAAVGVGPRIVGGGVEGSVAVIVRIAAVAEPEGEAAVIPRPVATPVRPVAVVAAPIGAVAVAAVTAVVPTVAAVITAVV